MVNEKLRNLTFILTPDAQWPTECTLVQKMSCIEHARQDCIYLTDFIRELSYGDFKKTPYWNAMSEYLLNKLGHHCAVCGASAIDAADIELHRNRFDSYGREWMSQYEKDFMPICSDCHQRLHKHFAPTFTPKYETLDNLVKGYRRK